jgi:hypothetical protein
VVTMTDKRKAIPADAAAAMAKQQRGERLDRQDLVALHAHNLDRLVDDTEPLLRAGKIGRALDIVFVELARLSIENRLKRDDIEARVGALEGRAKPRMKVPARMRLVS